MGVYVDDLLPYILADPQPFQGATTEVEIERYYKDENIIRAANLFSKESLAAMWGGLPDWLTFTTTGHTYLTFDISDPNNVALVGEFEDLGDGVGINYIPIYINLQGYDLVLGQYVVEGQTEPIKLVDGIIKFPTDASIVLGALSGGAYQGQFCEANPTGKMALYLPGVEYANCEMSVEYEGLSEPTNGGAGKAVFTFQTSADVASFKFAFVNGNVTDDPSEVVDAIVEGRSDLTIYESIENTATYEVNLPDGLWTLVAVPYTAKGTAWTQDAISAYFYVNHTGEYPEVDIQVAVGSVADITGNPAYEENFPSASTMCIYMQADGTQIKSITAFVGTDIPSEMTNEEVLAQAGQDFSSFIPDMVEYGYALAVYHNLTEGTTYDIVLGFETIYGELKTYRMQYTPITTRHTAERYGKEETLAELSNLQFRTLVYPEN